MSSLRAVFCATVLRLSVVCRL